MTLVKEANARRIKELEDQLQRLDAIRLDALAICDSRELGNVEKVERIRAALAGRGSNG